MKLFKLRSLTTLPSLLNIVGIAIAIATFYTLMSMADYSFTFNQSVKDNERICQVIYKTDEIFNGEWANSLSRPIGITLCNKIPQIEKYGCLARWRSADGYIEKGGSHSKINYTLKGCDSGLPEVFGFNIVEGDLSRFKTNNDMIISHTMAQKYGLKVGDIIFPDLNNLNYHHEIVAIFEDMKNNTEFGPIDAFYNLDQIDINENNWGYTYYIKIQNGITPEEFNSQHRETFKNTIRTVFEKQIGISQEMLDNLVEEFSTDFISINDLHLHSEIRGYHRHSDAKVIYTYVILAILVIAIAFINYFNFFMARVPKRIKDININKILGCDRTRLVLSIIGESIIFTLVAIVLALVVTRTIIPWFIDGVVDMNQMVFSNYKILTISILAAIAAAILTSLYPALHITSLPPALALKGKMTENNRNPLRFILVGFQVAASIALIICSLFIQKNNDYLLSRDIGYNPHNILTLWAPSGIVQKHETVRTKLLENPQITDITWTADFVVRSQGNFMSTNSPNNPDETCAFDILNVAKNFIDFMGIKITDGRNFMESDNNDTLGVAIFNETARRSINLTTESIFKTEKIKIAGFCSDFNFKPLQYDLSPCALFVNREGYLSKLFIRYADGANVQTVRNYINTTLAQIDPNFSIIQPEIQTFEQELGENYKEENNVSSMISTFTIIAIIISVMGIFGIVLFETESRRKEIGIRKVNGATIAEILSMFNRKYLILAAICSAIAIPISFFAVSTYFAGFAYHYPIAPWIFAIGIIIAVGITALVVTAASFRAANENPVKTLKTE